MSFILMDEKFKCLEDLPSHFSSAFMFCEAANSFFVVASRSPVYFVARTQTPHPSSSPFFRSPSFDGVKRVVRYGYGEWCPFVCKWINWVKDVDGNDDQIVSLGLPRPVSYYHIVVAIVDAVVVLLRVCTSMTCIIDYKSTTREREEERENKWKISQNTMCPRRFGPELSQSENSPFVTH